MQRHEVRIRSIETLGVLIVAALLLPAAAPVASDPEPSAPVLEEQVTVRVRMVDLLVVDRSGQPVTDLRRDEVELWDEGEKQQILDFYPAHRRFDHQPQVPVEGRAPAPDPSGETGAAATAAEPPTDQGDAAAERRWIIFLFDARNLSYQGRVRAARAVTELVEQLGSGDRVALMVDDDELRMLVPFTTRHERLLAYTNDPEGMSQRYRDIERRLEDLRDDTESCRDAVNLVECAKTAASNFAFETGRETETSLDHLESLLRSLGAIPDRKILFYVSEGFLDNPGDVAAAAVEHAIGQFGYNVNAVELFLMRDFRHRLDRIYELATRSRTGLYAVNTVRKMTDDLFSVERATDFGPENLPKARTDPFEATWQQVQKVHVQMARSTGAVALFRRDPQGLLAGQLQSAAGVYTISYTPTGFSWDRRKIKIKVSRKKARVAYRNRYSLVTQDERRLVGELDVSVPGPRDGGLVQARLRINGEGFAIAPDSKPPVSLASLFFELRDGTGRSVQDLYEVIAVPRDPERADSRGTLERPFALKVPPGDYFLRVDISDVNGPGRGSFSRSFTVPPALPASGDARDASEPRAETGS